MANKLYVPKDSNLNRQLDEILQKGITPDNLAVLNYVKLQSPDGTTYELTVDDEGNLSTKEV